MSKSISKDYQLNVNLFTALLDGSFNHIAKPMNLIELKSIGHYFDRDNNCLYPIFSDGEADTDNAIPVEDVDRDNGISDEDWETISK